VNKGVGKKIFRGSQWKIQDRQIASISLYLLYQWRVRGRTGHTPTPKAHLKRMLHQEPRVKMKTFFGETPIFGKILTF